MIILYPKLYAETPRHPDSKKLLDALGTAITSYNTCGGKHTRNRKCNVCREAT